MMQHLAPISGVATSRTGMVATAGYDNAVILWSSKAKRPLAVGRHDHLANSCAFSACGRFLVSSSSDYTARVWQIPEMRLAAVLFGHDDDIEMAAFDPTSRWIATCSRDRTIGVYRLDGAKIQRLRGHEADVISVSWDKTGRKLISSSDDGTIRIWDAMDGILLDTLSMDGVETDTIVISPRDEILAGDDDGQLTLVRGASRDTFKIHEAGIKRLVLDSQGGRLLTLSYDRHFALWNLEDCGAPELLHRGGLPSIVWPRSAAFIDDDTLAFATFGSTFATYSVESGIWNCEGISPSRSLNAVAEFQDAVWAIGDAGIVWRDGREHGRLGSLCNFLLPAGRALLTGGQSGELFDASSGATLFQHRSPLNCGAAFREGDADVAVVGSYTGEILMLRCGANPPAIERVVKVHDNAIKGLCVSDREIFSVGADGSARLLDRRDGSLISAEPRRHSKIANGCAYVEGIGFTSVGRDLNLALSGAAGTEVLVSPHDHSIKCCAASPDGHFIATASYSGVVAIYDTAARRWLEMMRPTSAGISSLCWAVGKQRFLASSYDGEVYEIDRQNLGFRHVSVAAGDRYERSYN